ncbi:DUF4041 domain-containing protein [Catellatospora sp. NPDC049133]|uniref:DUF4041 domain-containing protein n=1 Tax=Catellatospora sp. NPDC049133 TaxID=3155499 RepID=UPI00340BC709
MPTPPVSPAPKAVIPAQQAAMAAAPTLVAPAAGGPGSSLFGRGKKRLEDENQLLRSEITRLMGLDTSAIAAETASFQTALQRARGEYQQLQAQLTNVRAELVRSSAEAELQEVAIYEYRHPLADAVAYKERLADLNVRIKDAARTGNAVQAATAWTVNGSQAEGRKMINETSKLMLRAYNAEAENCVARVQPHRLDSTIERLTKVTETIARLGKTMSIRISPEYHQLRVYELRLTADYRAKVEEEKERIREERERMREEKAAAAEFEREKARLAKEQSHYQAALAKLTAKGDLAAAAEIEAKLQEIGEAIAGVEAREANIRAGYVYVISNIGAFGPGMVKIGMTRRLDPEDRVRELGDASVPFRFDVHALIFSEDAVGLEGKLHAALSAKRVNQVNLRREYFYATPAEVRELLSEIAGQHLLEYHETPEALEWRASHAGRATDDPAR